MVQGRWLKTHCPIRRSSDPVEEDPVVHLAKAASFPDRNAAADMAAADDI